jgi:DNA-directed RNA polymerase subunit N (RpoN/RPB10)
VTGEGSVLARCISCGDVLHPERAEKYDYCLKAGCREKHAAGLSMVSVGVNKAADQFQVLDERTKDELAAGKHHDPRRATYGKRSRQAAQAPAVEATEPPARKPASAPRRARRDPWTPSQERLALLYNERGLTPDEIAAKLGISRYAATQAVLAARNRRKRS